jgi:hypothetical protein
MHDLGGCVKKDFAPLGSLSDIPLPWDDQRISPAKLSYTSAGPNPSSSQRASLCRWLEKYACSPAYDATRDAGCRSLGGTALKSPAVTLPERLGRPNGRTKAGPIVEWLYF